MIRLEFEPTSAAYKVLDLSPTRQSSCLMRTVQLLRTQWMTHLPAGQGQDWLWAAPSSQHTLCRVVRGSSKSSSLLFPCMAAGDGLSQGAKAVHSSL